MRRAGETGEGGEGGRESEAGEGGRARQVGEGWRAGEGGREGGEGGEGGRAGEREREAGTTWLPHRSTLSRLPRGLSALSTSAGLFSGKKSLDSYLDT